jgi:hypothetical protein
MRRALIALGWVATLVALCGLLGAIVLLSGAVEAFGCRQGPFLRLSCPPTSAGRIGELLWTSALAATIALPVTFIAMVFTVASAVARLRARRPLV